MKEDNSLFVLDTSAILAYIEDEDGAEDVEELLIKAETKSLCLCTIYHAYRGILYINGRER